MRNAVSLIVALAFSTVPAFALMIDDFSVNTDPPGSVNAGYSYWDAAGYDVGADGSSVLGEWREYYVGAYETGTVAAELRVYVAGGEFYSSGDADIEGQSSVYWDGASNDYAYWYQGANWPWPAPITANPTSWNDCAVLDRYGLGGIDLTEGDVQDRFRLSAYGDHDWMLEVTVWSGSNETDWAFARQSITATTVYDNVYLPFSSFGGGAGTIDWHDVGAVRMTILNEPGVAELQAHVDFIETIPEPTTMGLLGVGGMLLMAASKRRKKK